jgi:hypothetical protein
VRSPPLPYRSQNRTRDGGAADGPGQDPSRPFTAPESTDCRACDLGKRAGHWIAGGGRLGCSGRLSDCLEARFTHRVKLRVPSSEALRVVRGDRWGPQFPAGSGADVVRPVTACQQVSLISVGGQEIIEDECLGTTNSIKLYLKGSISYSIPTHIYKAQAR